MSTELSRQGFIGICEQISERNFRRQLDVFGLLLERYSDAFLRSLDELWFELRYPHETYSPAVTVAALDAMQALVERYVASSRGNYQEELRNLERETESLRDQFAVKFNDPAAARFELDLKRVAEAAAREGYEMAPEIRGRGVWFDRPPFERVLAAAGLHVERDSPVYDALHEYFSPHFMKGLDDPFSPNIAAEFEQDRNQRDPSLN